MRYTAAAYRLVEVEVWSAVSIVEYDVLTYSLWSFIILHMQLIPGKQKPFNIANEF